MSTSSASQTLPGSSTAGFSAIFDAALNEYKSRTRQDLRTHPFAISLQTHNSPETILEIFRNQAQALETFRRGHDKLMSCLTPIVNMLFIFSATLGEAIGLVSPQFLSDYKRSYTTCISQPFSPGKTIFTGIGVLLGVSVVLYSLDCIAVTLDLGGEGRDSKLRNPCQSI
jgi:hypothetical protein